MADDVVWSVALRPEEDRTAFRVAVASYLSTLRENYASPTKAQPEDQLKAPVGTLVKTAGELGGRKVVFRTETKVDGIAGRPDLGFDTDGLPVGNLELKAPGLGADPSRFKDRRSRDQWDRFKSLPNLIYSDGESWALYRNGERVGTPIHLDASVTSGDEPAPDWAVDALLGMLDTFFNWSPVVPSNARALAAMLAPITRLLRDEVLQDVQEGGILKSLASEWRATLFPDATDKEFADGYAQTFTYALLLARLEGAKEPLTSETAAAELDADHALLGQTLRVLGQSAVREALSLPVALMERLIGAVDAAKLSKGPDLWLYFYEDFLAEYDPAQRNDRGVYYTPVPVVGFQVRTAHNALKTQLKHPDGIADESVRVLDPAAGTGTYPLAVAALAIDDAVDRGGPGLSAEIASRLATNIYAFEILVGPYAVTHLRLARSLTDAQGTLPPAGVNVFLTDTLAEPAEEGLAAQVNIFERKLAEEQERASRVKSPQTAITVVMGNPPYDREASGAQLQHRKGGMVRHKTSHGDEPLIQTFLNPLTPRVRGEQAMNLYNDYVYFWRWAIWKVCDQRDGPGIVSYITPNAFLAGAAFGGMRETLRREFDEIWVMDLGGDGRARVDDNVFDILTPVCITVAIRFEGSEHRTDAPARLFYRRIEGTRAEKYAALDAEDALVASALWRPGVEEWQGSFIPSGGDAYAGWPLLSQIMPWSARGMQFSRTWPVSESRDVLTQRWQALLDAPPQERGELLHESRDSRASDTPKSFLDGIKLARLDSLDSGAQPDGYRRIGFRSFDRQWALSDYRVIDMPRAALWRTAGERQVFFTSILDDCTSGPALVANAYVPDLNSYNNRGGLCVPLFRDREGSRPNVTVALVAQLQRVVDSGMTAEEVAAYVYGITGSGAFTKVFSNRLHDDGLRVPLTLDAETFAEVARFGRELAWVATFGERVLTVRGGGPLSSKIDKGRARVSTAIQGPDDHYPDSYAYDEESRVLRVGVGAVDAVSPEVWAYEVSGYRVVESWLAYRMKERAGRASSRLDAIRPERWRLSQELVEVLWVVERLTNMEAEGERLLHLVLETELLQASDSPPPLDLETKEPPKVEGPVLFEEDLTGEET